MRIWFHSVLGVLFLLSGTVASAQDIVSARGDLVLQPQSPIEDNSAAFPRVAGNGNAVRRINASLDAIDADLRKAIQGCRQDALANGGKAGWTRTVDVTMRGPQYLSLVAQDDPFCGGAHPNADTLALVFDRDTGRPVDWQRLLPSSLAPSATLATGLGGSREGLVMSPPLLSLYRNRYPAELKDIDPTNRDECRDSVQDGFTIWPDARTHSLMIQPTTQNFAAAACAVPISLPASLLAGLGTDSALVAALRAAR